MKILVTSNSTYGREYVTDKRIGLGNVAAEYGRGEGGEKIHIWYDNAANPETDRADRCLMWSGEERRYIKVVP